MYKCGCTDTHKHTLKLKCVDCIFVSLEDACRCIFVFVSLELLLCLIPLFLSLFFLPPSFAGKPSNQRFVCLLFLFCFCSPSVRRCACVCDCVLVNLFSILPVTCWPFSLHLIRSSSSSSSTSSSSLSSFVISLCLFVGSPGSERATKTNETWAKRGN